MAALRSWQRLFSSIVRNHNSVRFKSFYSKRVYSTRGFKVLLTSAAGFGSLAVYQAFCKENNWILPAVQAAKDEDEAESPSKTKETNYREMRFRQFASVEYDGNIYMTPQDFLESVTEESPRARIGRAKLSPSDVASMLRYTPKLSKGSDRLFRKLHEKGIISYTEYLFLLCVLTKPQSGFRIAFNMFDTDGNQIVDKREFLVLETFFALPRKERKFVPRDPRRTQALLDLEKVFGDGSKPPQPETSAGSGKLMPEAGSTAATAKKPHAIGQEIPDTTLLVHFFGQNGKNVLKYDDFHRFMENLQSEVIEMEFLEFSRGLNTISEVEFARILLRYTNLDRGDKEECLQRIRERMPNETGISFNEFKKFCQFLNNLDDFAIAMKMYTFAQQPVSQEEFLRAVMVCTGFSLGSHIVNTVFNIFDKDGDGHLSHKEFISLMKDRLHRGARSHLMHSQNTLEAFKTCVKNEMRTF